MILDEIVEASKDEIVEFLKQLIRIPTENPPGLNYDKIVSMLRDKLEEFGYKTEIIEGDKELVRFGSGNRPNLIGYLGNGNVRIAFNGHYDVVPAGEGWSVNPYEGIEKDGKVYGRGASDMKSGIVAQIYAVEMLKRAKLLSPNVKIIQTFVPDEETVGNKNAGTYCLREIYKKNADYVIFTEPTGPDNICNGHRGAIWAVVKVYGKKSHGGFPQLGIDAVKASAIMIERLYASLPNITSKYNITPEAGKKPSILVGTVKCGTWVNTVADYCEFSIVRRLIPEERIDEVRESILRVLRNVSSETGVKFDYDEFYAVDTVVSEDKRLIEALRKSIKEVRGVDPNVVLSAGTFDIRFTVSEGIKSINYGPGRIELAHATDEFVYVKDLLDSIKVLGRVLLEVAKGS
ncbi:Acetylornithine deacetylase [Saccharolobus shibatae B12]|uniref:Probable succinyl-diaminopimelate desuccinylase n=1 Tax=Saccharolobus shibatae (strain ATCC 51178 / DSM 5389 / JCM 8931 / NBRC 15437 / B12) TaxID=523848 RepID=A0A8F5BP40_SACSH|nr:M20 family metallopeptidase [Saccharolobus shibatae]QXJ28736.1 Acetylornithine deacetylase [Saccharolobus shibatae B12]